MTKHPGSGVLLAALALCSTVRAHDGPEAAELPEADVFYHIPTGVTSGEIYSDQAFAGPFVKAVGLEFDDAGRLFVWERRGRVWFVDGTGQIAPTSLIDIHEEVGNWGDHGLLGMALDPDFTTNGYLYLLYVVDYHHLIHFGQPTYDPQQDDDFVDTIGRITRYQVMNPGAPGDQLEVDPASRTILVGETIDAGFPVCANSHGVGSLVFGEDGSLLASCGDGFLGLGNGNCLSDGILTGAEDVENYRAQLLGSLSGKVIRIDPGTGDGMPTNPFFDDLDPRSARSRVWLRGLRQPFRLTVRPGTGSAIHPGTLYLGDVGAQTWEELNVATDGGTNFGWPAYEGMDVNSFYYGMEFESLEAPNPLFGQVIPGIGECDQEYFLFQDLLAQETLGVLDLSNPCDPAQEVPLELQTMHVRPVLAWEHDTAVTLTKTFTGGLATTSQLGEPGCPVAGDSFAGNASVGGVWYTGSDFPELYQDAYFQADYGAGWIKCFRFDAFDQPLEVIAFSEDAGNPVALATHPTDGALYYIDLKAKEGSAVRRISFVGNLPPVADAAADVTVGPQPLSVQFDSGGSFDPETGPLLYEWDFGDGDTSTEANPTHVYTDALSMPVGFTATLTVTDDLGLTDVDTVHVSINNTPPVVQITSPLNGQTYSSVANELVALEADITDAEHSGAELGCAWDVLLYHDNHTHPEHSLESCSDETTLGPHTNPGDVEHYEIELTVTDAAGLSTQVTHYLTREDDCNLNGYPDADDIGLGTSLDLDMNGVPDECQSDCDGDGISDVFAFFLGFEVDCNGNGVPDACDISTGSSLDIDADGVPDDCQPFQADLLSVSVSAGGTQTLTLDLGRSFADGFYWILGSFTGTSPGTPFGPVLLPLTTPDVYFNFTLVTPNVAPLIDTAGFLDASGRATAQIAIPMDSQPALAGITAYHAAFVTTPNPGDISDILAATNAMPLELVP